jgi:hypothetical protein
MSSRGILTLAVGKPKYIERAKSLARSLILHDPHLMRGIITDSRDPELGDLFTYRIDLRPEHSFDLRQKMFLDRYTPFEETLFIDSDSLVIHSLDVFWSTFAPVPFGVCGNRTLQAGDTDEALDVPFILDHFKLTSLPKFNGGTYYFKRTPEAAAVFTTARELLDRSTELRFPTVAIGTSPYAGPTDEALYSVAMAIHGLTVTNMGPGGMWTAIDSATDLSLDVSKGTCSFVKRGRLVVPDILHLASFCESRIYLRECFLLERLAQGRPKLTRSEELQLTSTAVILWARRKAKRIGQRLRHLFPTVPSSIEQH